MDKRVRVNWWLIWLSAFIASMLTVIVMDCDAAPGDWSLNVHVASHHFDYTYYNDLYTNEEKELNEFNPGIGFVYEWTEYIESRGGLFLNSFDKASLYAGMGVHTSYDRLFSVSLQGGILTGYDGTPAGGENKLVGYVIPVLGLNTGQFRTELGYIVGRDKAGFKANDVLTLGFVWRFK